MLSPESVEKLLAPHVSLGEHDAAGYGWFLTDTPHGKSVWTRGTEDFGHNAMLMTYPEHGVVITAVTNAGERDGVPAARKLAADLAPVIFGK